MTPAASPEQHQLIELARDTAWFMEALRAARSLRLPDWCIGAGAVRNLVWDALHERRTPSALSDVDVAYFDATSRAADHDATLAASLQAAVPQRTWDVTNQANVHRWFAASFGHPVEPLRSLEEAVGSWPEYATSVGLRLESDDGLTVIAPHGLTDLFAMIVRRNPTRVSLETYRDRVRQKRYVDRWPQVRVISC